MGSTQVSGSEILEIEELYCMGCGNFGDIKTCVTCRAKELGCGNSATAIMIYKDENGCIESIEEIWVH